MNSLFSTPHSANQFCARLMAVSMSANRSAARSDSSSAGDPPPWPHSLGSSAGEPVYVSINVLPERYLVAYMPQTPRFVVQLH